MQALYHRLLLIVGPGGSGKTSALREVGQRMGSTVTNVNLELSRKLLDLTEQQRVHQIRQHLDRIVAETHLRLIILDNIELLFDVWLKQDPLRLLTRSRET
jgi:ABC-type lipoprotein export system ATPase subunit